MAGHTRLSPGIEFQEIDRSKYNQKTDQSIVGTTSFLAGFADTGEDYTVQWIDRMSTFQNEYGYPKNEIERYFYNGVAEILNNGGRCLAAKLPYSNDAKDHFTAVEYVVKNSDADLSGNSDVVEYLNTLDSSILSCASIEFSGTKTLSMEDFDKSRVGNSIAVNGNTKNKIWIVDITRGMYGKTDLRVGKSLKMKDAQILGILPVVTGAANAIFFQNAIYRENSQILTDKYNPVYELTNRQASGQQPYISSITDVGDNFNIGVSSGDINEQTLSKQAVEFFPTVNWINDGIFERRNLKYIGVVVFKLCRNAANEDIIDFVPVEAFTGSVDKWSKNEKTGASDYIGNVINQSSQYINLFSNVARSKNLDCTSTYIVRQQSAAVLGFYDSECVKHIDYNESIIDPLTRIFDRIEDSNQVPLDLVLDAGVSNIAQYVKEAQAMTGVDNATSYPFIILPDGNSYSNMTMRNETPAAWKVVLGKYDDFCKNIRRDCMFLADGPRQLVLEGNEKVIRPTRYDRTILQNIIPKIKYMQVLNSSYSAGYCNWFLGVDEYSGEQFWIPPSIKMAGVYTYTDAYFHQWNAPAGLNRGKIGNVYDVSFNPMRDQAGRIYQQAWNYAASYPVDGIVAEGQKTFQIQQTALDRVNVRRLMLYIEKGVIQIARRFLYEGNTEYTRQRFVDTIVPLFEEAKSGDGLKEYAIKCDAELNTVEAIENHELHCVIGVKPVKTIEWIKLSFIVTNQTANVQEEVQS